MKAQSKEELKAKNDELQKDVVSLGNTILNLINSVPAEIELIRPVIDILMINHQNRPFVNFLVAKLAATKEKPTNE